MPLCHVCCHNYAFNFSHNCRFDYNVPCLDGGRFNLPEPWSLIWWCLTVGLSWNSAFWIWVIGRENRRIAFEFNCDAMCRVVVNEVRVFIPPNILLSSLLISYFHRFPSFYLQVILSNLLRKLTQFPRALPPPSFWNLCKKKKFSLSIRSLVSLFRRVWLWDITCTFCACDDEQLAW